jgi:hypothetical protein
MATNDPSYNGVQNSKDDKSSNSMVFVSQYQGQTPLINPQLLGQSASQQKSGLDVNSASAGNAQSEITLNYGQTASSKANDEPNTQKNDGKNQPYRIGNQIVKGYKGNDELDAKTDSENETGGTAGDSAGGGFKIPSQSEVNWDSSSEAPEVKDNGSVREPIGPRDPRAKKSFLDSDYDLATRFANSKKKIGNVFKRAQGSVKRHAPGEGPQRYAPGEGPLRVGGAGVVQPPAPQERPEIRESYNPAQLAILRAQAENQKLTELQEGMEDREQGKTIGARENTGLATRYSRPGADLVVKPQDNIVKSIATYANFNWIPEGARENDSKLTINSSLQKLWDGYNEERFSNTYNPQLKPYKNQCEEFEDHRDEIKKFTSNRFIPQSSSTQLMDAQSVPQNIQFGMRPAMARPPTLHDVGDYTYNHNGIVGTTNLGLVSERIYNMPDYMNDTLHYSDVIIERETGVKKYI